MPSVPKSLNHSNVTDIEIKNFYSLKPVKTDDEDYSFDKNGPIRVSMNLARVVAALSGQDNSNAARYKLVNLQLRFKSVPDDGSKGAMMMLSHEHIKQTINSNSANISA